LAATCAGRFERNFEENGTRASFEGLLTVPAILSTLDDLPDRLGGEVAATNSGPTANTIARIALTQKVNRFLIFRPSGANIQFESANPRSANPLTD
jgi:hypothetical protein